MPNAPTRPVTLLSSPTYLVMPEAPTGAIFLVSDSDDPNSAIAMVGRRIVDPVWSPSRMRPAPETIRSWSPMTEHSWVALNSIGVYPEELRQKVMVLVGRSQENHKPDLDYCFAEAYRNLGDDGAWCLALQIAITFPNLADQAISFAVRDAPTAIPELIHWANYVALLGCTNSIRTSPMSSETADALIARFVRCIPAQRLGRMLVDIQLMLERTPEMSHALISAGAGSYLWQDADHSPWHKDAVALRFLRPIDAIEWLCDSLSTESTEESMRANPRRRLRPFRDMIRKQEMRLVDDVQGVNVPATQIIEAIDDFTVGRSPQRRIHEDV